MPSKITIPARPLERFAAIYEALASEAPWWADASRFRHGAMAAILCEGNPLELARRLRKMSKALEKASPWHWGVSSSVRFAVSALLIQNGDTASGFIKELKRVRKLFRGERLHRGLTYELLAVLILRIQAGGAPISSDTVDRFKAIYEETKRHQRWLTGPDDFPACAILTGQQGTTRKVADDVEALYQELRNHKFTKSNSLQAAAHTMYLAEGTPRTVARRAAGLRDQLKQHKIRTSSRDYADIAGLTILERPADRVVRRVVELRDDLRRLRPKIHRSTLLSLGSGIAFLELAAPTEQMTSASRASMVARMTQAIVAAQQAALMTVATMAAVSASTSAASSAASC